MPNAASHAMLCFVRYGTFKLVQKMPGGETLVAFTRILHRTKPDILMDEVGVHRNTRESLSF